jgi:hypothetical protein
MTERKFCDSCDEEIKNRGVELDIFLGEPLGVGEEINQLMAKGPLHFHRECFEEIQEEIFEAIG